MESGARARTVLVRFPNLLPEVRRGTCQGRARMRPWSFFILGIALVIFPPTIGGDTSLNESLVPVSLTAPAENESLIPITITTDPNITEVTNDLVTGQEPVTLAIFGQEPVTIQIEGCPQTEQCRHENGLCVGLGEEVPDWMTESFGKCDSGCKCIAPGQEPVTLSNPGQEPVTLSSLGQEPVTLTTPGQEPVSLTTKGCEQTAACESTNGICVGEDEMIPNWLNLNRENCNTGCICISPGQEPVTLTTPGQEPVTLPTTTTTTTTTTITTTTTTTTTTTITITRTTTTITTTAALRCALCSHSKT